MAGKALDFFLRLLDLRKNRSALLANRARADLERAQTFETRLNEYHHEYQKAWVDSATSGGTADELYAKAAFVSRLRETVAAQQPEVAAATERFQRASGRVTADALRADTLRKYLTARREARRVARERREEREANDRGGYRPR